MKNLFLGLTQWSLHTENASAGRINAATRSRQSARKLHTCTLRTGTPGNARPDERHGCSTPGNHDLPIQGGCIQFLRHELVECGYAPTFPTTPTGLIGVTAVDFGTTPAATFTVISATSIMAASPAGTGTVDATVVAPDKTSAISPADHFSYGPVVTGLSPAGGVTGGGTLVTITGTGFIGATAVYFGTSPGTDLTVVSDTTITASSPAGTGTVDVTVTNPIGTSPLSPADVFTYGPTLTAYGAPQQADLQWNSVQGATEYLVEEWNAATSSWVQIAATNQTTDAVNGLTPGTAYEFSVVAVGAAGLDMVEHRLRHPNELAAPPQTGSVAALMPEPSCPLGAADGSQDRDLARSTDLE